MTNSAANPATSSNETFKRSSDIVQIFLADEEGQSVLGIDDGARRQSLRVIIVNTSGNNITLKDLEKPLSATDYHFCISFRPGTLADQGKDVTLTVEDDQGQKIEGWQILPPDNNTFYLGLDKSAAAKAKSISVGKRLTFVFGNIGAAPAGGSRGTRVEVQFAQLESQGSKISGTRLQYLNIVNQRGKKQIPLYAGFLGSNTILNDGSENELTLSIQSLPRQSLPLRIEPYSSDRFNDLQNVKSNQKTSFGKTAIELLQDQAEFKLFFIDIMNRAIEQGMKNGIVLNKLFDSFGWSSSSSMTTLFTDDLEGLRSITTEVKSGFTQKISDIINEGHSTNLLNDQKSIQQVLDDQNIQKSFIDEIFKSDSRTQLLFNEIQNSLQNKLDPISFLRSLLPDGMANLKPFDKLKEENSPSIKQELANALITSVTSNNLISQDDLKIILTELAELNFTPASTKLTDLNIIRLALDNLDNTKPLERSVLGLKGIKGGDTLDLTTTNDALNIANDALDESVRIRISFDVYTSKENDSKHKNGSEHWALVEKPNADDIQISIAQGQDNWIFGGKLEQGITPQWNFVCKKSLQLDDRQEILRLSIRNLKTQLLAGYANLYVHYENFPGYWDGFINVPIHKGPLVYREREGTDQVKIGCVGIGTDEPQAKLHVKVKSSSGVVGLKVEGDAAITGHATIENVAVNKQLTVQGNTAIAGELNITPLDEDVSRSSDGWYDRSAGLNVSERNQTKPFVIAGTENNNAFLKLRARTSYGQEGFQWEITAQDDNSLSISNRSSETPDKLVITDNGVGIGTTDVGDNKLTVQGNTTISGNLSVSPGRGGVGSTLHVNGPIYAGTSEIYFTDSNHNHTGIGNAAGYAAIENSKEHDALMILGRTGTPDKSNVRRVKLWDYLEVNGDFALKNNQNQFKIYLDENRLTFEIQKSFWGKQSARKISWDGDGNWDLESDLSLKTDIENEENILSRLLQLNVKNYNWKDDSNKLTKKVGFIAQEVQPVFPSLVGELKNEEKDESILTLKYAQFGVLAVGGLKELKLQKDAEIFALRSEISALRNELRQLKSDVIGGEA